MGIIHDSDDSSSDDSNDCSQYTIVPWSGLILSLNVFYQNDKQPSYHHDDDNIINIDNIDSNTIDTTSSTNDTTIYYSNHHRVCHVLPLYLYHSHHRSLHPLHHLYYQEPYHRPPITLDIIITTTTNNNNNNNNQT